MAQSVERYLGKVEVTGSSPVSSFEASQWGRFFYICKKCFSLKHICFSQKYNFACKGFTFLSHCASMIKTERMWKRKKEAANDENESCFCIRIFLFLPCFQRFNVNFTVRKDGLFSWFFLRESIGASQ